MNAPPPPDVSHIPEALREFVCEHLWYVSHLVEIGQLHALIGDDEGLRRDVRRMIAYMRAIIETVAELPRSDEEQK